MGYIFLLLNKIKCLVSASISLQTSFNNLSKTVNNRFGKKHPFKLVSIFAPWLADDNEGVISFLEGLENILNNSAVKIW